MTKLIYIIIIIIIIIFSRIKQEELKATVMLQLMGPDSVKRDWFAACSYSAAQQENKAQSQQRIHTRQHHSCIISTQMAIQGQVCQCSQ